MLILYPGEYESGVKIDFFAKLTWSAFRLYYFEDKNRVLFSISKIFSS